MNFLTDIHLVLLLSFPLIISLFFFLSNEQARFVAHEANASDLALERARQDAEAHRREVRKRRKSTYSLSVVFRVLFTAHFKERS
jgi:hypothetical protein